MVLQFLAPFAPPAANWSTISNKTSKRLINKAETIRGNVSKLKESHVVNVLKIYAHLQYIGCGYQLTSDIELTAYSVLMTARLRGDKKYVSQNDCCGANLVPAKIHMLKS